jgi:hypothetical protein
LKIFDLGAGDVGKMAYKTGELKRVSMKRLRGTWYISKKKKRKKDPR